MDDFRAISTIYMGAMTANDMSFGSDWGEKSKTFDQQLQKSCLILHRWASQDKLAHHIIIHWIHMDDFRGISTTFTSAVTANDMGFGSDWGEKSKTFDQQH